MKPALALSLLLAPVLAHAATLATATCYWEAGPAYEAGSAQLKAATEAGCEAPFASAYAAASYGAVRAMAASVWHEYRFSFAEAAAAFTQYATFAGAGSGFVEFSGQYHGAELTVNGSRSRLVPILFNTPVEIRAYAHAHGSDAAEIQFLAIESIQVYDSRMQALATFDGLLQQPEALYGAPPPASREFAFPLAAGRLAATLATPEPNHALLCGLLLIWAAAYRWRSHPRRSSGTGWPGTPPGPECAESPPCTPTRTAPRSPPRWPI